MSESTVALCTNAECGRCWMCRADRAERQAAELAKALERIEPFLSFASKDYEDGMTEDSAHALWREAVAAVAAYREGR